MEKELRVIISGGGTGGHIFPAVSIANAVKALRPDAKILFVGALGRMEMQRVPAAGYEIKGLPICGFDRKNLLKNFKVLYKIWKSQRMAKQIIKDFKPQVAVGVGGYASGPTLNKAAAMGVPCLIQEQNSYAGVTNKLLAKKAAKICVAYEGMERFFPADKIILTGNPVRQALLDTAITREEAIKTFGLDPAKKTILLVGGSLGARTINESVLQHLDLVKGTDVQFIWQTGKYYSAEIAKRLEGQNIPNLVVTDFITDMGKFYPLPLRLWEIYSNDNDNACIVNGLIFTSGFGSLTGKIINMSSDGRTMDVQTLISMEHYEMCNGRLVIKDV